MEQKRLGNLTQTQKKKLISRINESNEFKTVKYGKDLLYVIHCNDSPMTPVTSFRDTPPIYGVGSNFARQQKLKPIASVRKSSAYLENVAEEEYSNQQLAFEGIYDGVMRGI